MTALLAWTLLAATAVGIGQLVRDAGGNGAPRLGPPTTALLGALALAALLPNLFQIGLPRALLLAGTYGAAAAGHVRWLRARRPHPLDPRALGTACVFALALQAPIALATTMPPLSSDAALVWWPKVAEIAAGSRPQVPVDEGLHLLPFYPRGMAWLANVAWPWGTPPAEVARATPLLLVWLTALVMADFVRSRDRPGAALLLGLGWLLLPGVAQNANAGLGEPGVAAAVLLSGLGLHLRRRHRLGHVVAITAGAGAASIKEEGSLVLLVVVATFAADLLHRHRRRPALAAGGAAALALLPFALWRGQVPQSRFDTLGLLLADPDLLLLRAAAVVESILRMLVAPGSLRMPLEDAFAMPVCWIGWVVVGSLAVLIPRRGPPHLPVRSALVLLAGALLVYTASSADVRWHVRTTLPRLMVEVAPLLLLAASSRLLLVGANPARSASGDSPERAPEERKERGPDMPVLAPKSGSGS